MLFFEVPYDEPVFVKHIEIAQNAGTGVRRTLLPRWLALATMGAMGCGAVSIEPSLQSDDAGASSLDAIAVEPPGQDAQFSDDATVALVVVPAEFTDVNAPMRILQAGDHVDLIRAPQGGHISMLAAQVRNMTTDAATIRVRMRRPDTGFIVAEEKRTVAMVAACVMWGANPACPSSSPKWRQ